MPCHIAVVCHLLACFFFMWPILLNCDEGAALSTDLSGAAQRALQCSVDHADDRCEATSAVGWHWAGTCMQNSWRQAFGLEEICETGTRAEVSAKLLACQKMHELGLQPGESGVWAGEEFVAPDAPCKKCLSAGRLYIDAMYWSLTTMTTIGYGDRGPKTGSEITFVLFAEVFGLCVFALLLDQISKLGAAVGAEDQQQSDSKNAVVQFMIARGMKISLIDRCVKYLNFRMTTLSGHGFDADTEEFKSLSPGLRTLMQHEMFRVPVIERVQFFGWHADDLGENERCRKYTTTPAHLGCRRL